MANIIIPKHTAETVYFDATMEALVGETDWILMSAFTDKLFGLLVKIGKESHRSSDNTHYTKCAQLPMYFGFVERKVEGGKTYLRINDRGRLFFDAISKNDRTTVYRMILESIEHGNFGELNMGVPSSRSDIDPPAVFVRASYDLEGLSNKEFAYLVWSLVDRNDDYTGTIETIRKNRKRGSWELPKEAQNYQDCKPMMLLYRWGFLCDGKNGMAVSDEVDGFYHNRLLSLKIYSVDKNNSDIQSIQQPVVKNRCLQLITYGAPGTGKSHRVDALTNETNAIRVTFHPDTDYSMFVGSYKPTMAAQERYALDATGKTHKIDAKEMAISYSFVPQAFLKAYVEAWRRWCNVALADEEKRLYLVIEEINRGNCAQIFGDMFQLLDRCESGWSCYAVAPDDDIQRFLGEDAKYGLGGLAWTDNVVNDEGKTIATAEQVKTGARMVLPPNLCILATMNTSDQSLFPIDSAFKRRWDWEYVPITEGQAKDGEPLGWKIRPVEKTEDIAEGTPEYDWWDFVRGVNARISAATRSEDKKIGYFFVKPEALDGKKVVTAKKILSKVIFYLWNDVFKDLGFARIFSRNGKGVEFNEFYGADGKMNVDLVREFVETIVGKTDAAPAQQG